MDELARASARRAALEALRAEEGGSVGYYGVPLGTAIGIPFLAAEPRVAAAVLGLALFDALGSAEKTLNANPGTPAKSTPM